jgi:riboflavin synthase
MFTGLIQSIGTIAGIRTIPGGKALQIRHDFIETLDAGASVAVNGVCLTVTEDRQGIFTAECYFETLRKSSLYRFRPGKRVNLEQALRADSRLDGHFVQGHVSAVVRVLRVIPQGKGTELTVSLPEKKEGIIREGSVALDGVSLTIADLQPDSLSVQLIGETLERTVLKECKPGDPVNLESDLLLRAGNRGLQEREKERITMSLLAQWGYV